MSVDTELDLWREQWQSSATVPLDLKKRVERQTRIMRWVLIADIAITVILGGVTTISAVQHPRPEMVTLALATWFFLAVAWTFALLVNHGKWSPSALDTSAFLDLCIRRCRGRLSTIKFGACLFMLELVFCLSWIYRNSSEPPSSILAWLFFSSIPMSLVWIATLGFFGTLLWYRRKKRAELAYLLEMQAQVSQGCSC